MTETKRFAGQVAFKAATTAADSGDFSCRVYVVDGPPDADGDVIARGAIQDGVSCKVSLAQHDTLLDATLEPAGDATLHHVGQAVHAVGRARDSARGRELRTMLKKLGPAAQWSVGYKVRESREPTADELAIYPDLQRRILVWEVPEISPVQAGACGPTCRTLGAKARTGKPACRCGTPSSVNPEAMRREYERFQTTSRQVAQLLNTPEREVSLRRQIALFRAKDGDGCAVAVDPDKPPGGHRPRGLGRCTVGN
jgi:hypothetical protein